MDHDSALHSLFPKLLGGKDAPKMVYFVLEKELLKFRELHLGLITSYKNSLPLTLLITLCIYFYFSIFP